MEKRKDPRGRNLRDGEDVMKDGRYRYRYEDKAGRHAVYSWTLTPTDKPPAGKRKGESLREKEKRIQADLRDGIDSRRAAKLTLDDMFLIYMDSKAGLKQTTRLNYQYMYNTYVSDSLGKHKISAIKYTDIKRFYNSLIHEKHLQLGTIGIIQNLLHPTFEMAVRDDYIRKNPTIGVLPEIKKAENWEQKKRHALTIEEQTAFINFVSASKIYSKWLPLFTVLLGTGCRIGELLGLRWTDCDFTDRMISINHTLVYKKTDCGHCELRISTPKTSAGCRTIPILEEVYHALLQERRNQMALGYYCKTEIDGYSGFIFISRSGSVYRITDINRVIDRIIKAYNEQEQERASTEHREPLLLPHFSAHNLRHTFCTRFCENETNVKVIQEIMGHTDIATTMNIYAEATENAKKESIKNLEGKIKIS